MNIAVGASRACTVGAQTLWLSAGGNTYAVRVAEQPRATLGSGGEASTTVMKIQHRQPNARRVGFGMAARSAPAKVHAATTW